MDKETREILRQLTAEVSRLSTLVEANIAGDEDKETRLRKVERWLYAIPGAYVLTLGSVFTAAVRLGGN